MIVFVTGAFGFIGKHLCPRLLQLGYHVETDFTDYIPEKRDVIIHLAAKTDTSLEFNYPLIETNFMMTKWIFSFPSRIIFASSCSAGHLTCPYAYSKRYGEYLSQSHENSISLRFHNVYGSGARRGIVKFLMDKKDGDDVLVRGPALIRDYVHVYDVCTQIINSIKNGQKGVVDVGTGVGTATVSLVKMYMELSGKNFDIDLCKPWGYEPLRMVSSIPCDGVNLKTGLLKVINHEDLNYGSLL